MASAIERAFVSQDGGIGVSCAGSSKRHGERAGKQSDAHDEFLEMAAADSPPSHHPLDALKGKLRPLG